jgi:hypothetical protein
LEIIGTININSRCTQAENFFNKCKPFDFERIEIELMSLIGSILGTFVKLSDAFLAISSVLSIADKSNVRDEEPHTFPN